MKLYLYRRRVVALFEQAERAGDHEGAAYWLRLLGDPDIIWL